jgi:protein-S-isoprenylcysteine O-methyltransferase Ste14
MVCMRKVLAVVYGVSVYGFFGVTWAYFIGFLAGVAVPKTIDSGAIAPLPEALAIDIGCLALFFAHHSAMARARAKLAVARFLPPAVERSTYVLVASVAMVLLIAMWRPMPQVVWRAGGAVRVVVLVVFWTGVLVTVAGSHMLDGLELFGVRQVVAHFRGRAIPSVPFRTPGLYRLVRHPMMTGMLMTFWAGPTMTQGRVLLATAMSGYILAAVKWLEERDLRKAFGTEYERYERNVPMLLPMRMRRPSRNSAADVLPVAVMRQPPLPQSRR